MPAPRLISRAFPASPVRAAAGLATSTPGPYPPVHILTQGASFPAGGSVPTTPAPWPASEGTRAALPQPWGRVPHQARRHPEGGQHGSAWKRVTQHVPGVQRRGSGSCLPSLMLLSCSSPTSESRSPSHAEGVRSGDRGAAPQLGTPPLSWTSGRDLGRVELRLVQHGLRILRCFFIIKNGVNNSYL